MGALLFAVFAIVVVVGAEVFLAWRREYLPTEPAFEIAATAGPEDGRPLRFVVLGDSTAAGLGASGPQASYAAVLAERLGALGWRVEMTGLGVSGARVKDLLGDQLSRAEAIEPDLIFVGIGANDVTHLTGLDDVRRDATSLFEGLRKTGAELVVAGAPDMRADAFFEPLRSLAGWRGRRVSAQIAAAAEAVGVPLVPLAELAGPYFASGAEDAYGGDDFHPGDGGYRAWADAIFPYLREVIGAPEDSG
jgi:lysophospholipase L1-like esterase